MRKAFRVCATVAAIGIVSSCEYDGRWEDRADRQDQSPSPAPAATSPSTDTTTGFPSGTQWIFYKGSPWNWPVTINLTHAAVRVNAKGSGYHEVVVRYDHLQNLPSHYVPGDPNNVHNVNGSIWLLRQYNGQWYMGTIDYLRKGQMNKYFRQSPSYYFVPRSGDRVGFMVSTVNRNYNGTIVTGDGNSPYRQRSNIAWVTWP